MNSNTIRATGRAAAALAMLVIALPAAAQWTGKGEAGIALASGNTDTKTANAKIAIARKADAWEHSGSLAGLYVRNDGDTWVRRRASASASTCSGMAARATKRTNSAASSIRA
jgi:hypothetical protein